jgi:ABC-type transporter MlaC component
MRKKEYPYQNLSLKDIKGEQWEDIPGLDGYFAVSNYGRIKRMEYETQYSDGRIYIHPERIIKPRILNYTNRFVGDCIPFLSATLSLSKTVYRFGIARLVYHCFVHPLDLEDRHTMIFTKDYDRFNIRPSNLMTTTPGQKNKRVYERNRRVSHFLNVSEAIKEKRTQSMIKKTSKKVSQYTLEGKKVKTYPSTAAAQRATGILRHSIGQVAALKGISAGGFVWRWGNDKRVDIKSLKDARRNEYRKKYGQKVTQYDMKGNKIASYSSLQDAEAASGVLASSIRFVVEGTYKSAGGYFWKKGYGKKKINQPHRYWGKVASAQARFKKVKQFTLEGKYLRTFSSLKEAAHYLGIHRTGIGAACKGKQKICGGYRWRFV